MSEISLQPQQIFEIFGVAINNAVLSSFFVTLIIAGFSVWMSRNINLIPGRTQNTLEMTISYFHNQIKDIYPAKDSARKHTTLIVSLFIFIFIANQFSLIPLSQSLIINGISAFKPSTAHLSQTLALALIVVGISHYVALKTAPVKHILNYIKIEPILKIRSPKDIGNAFLELFLSLLDMIGEFAKVVSLAARLFGNVFAGEVMVVVIAGLSIYTQFIIPIPFYILSIFSGIIQALVFAFLAMSYISGTVKNVESSD